MAPAEIVASSGLIDVIRKGDVVLVLTRAVPGMPDELVDALGRRRQAALAGRCECGAEVRYRTAHGRARLVCRHESDCPADDATVAALLRGWAS